MYYAKDFIDKLQKEETLVIYGARIVAKEVATCLMGAPYHMDISAFMVSTLEGNPKELCGLPVVDISSCEQKYKDSCIIVAVLERYQDEIKATLEEKRFHNVVYLTFESDLWSEVRGNYFKHMIEQCGKSFLTLEEELEKIQVDTSIDSKEEVHVYCAKCIVDRVLKTDVFQYDWELPIQVGAALTEKRIADIIDNHGENISEKNKTHCELTALYWIWKNDKAKYAGLCHYRRHFAMDREMLDKLAISDIDVVVTIPILNFPNVQAMYENDHCQEDWEIMMQAIQNLYPDYEKTAKQVANDVFYYAYNMFIARKEVLDDYCEWLFSILDYCEIHCQRKENSYQNRFIGFLSERLLTIYLLHNVEKLKIVHGKKKFVLE
ncbi:MAG: DUF4422 domain-containing protein [Agathobacter sp.]|nr:DUF4422 domain-containing protein [Agathobacter sp.]